MKNTFKMPNPVIDPGNLYGRGRKRRHWTVIPERQLKYGIKIVWTVAAEKNVFLLLQIKYYKQFYTSQLAHDLHNPMGYWHTLGTHYIIAECFTNSEIRVGL